VRGARRQTPRALLAAVLLGAALTVVACSPEATRTRSGGPGADVGNRTTPAQIHGSTDPYYETPRYGQAAGQ